MTMKALFIAEPGKTELREVPLPRPAADELLLRVRRVGYCGSDLNTFRGRNPMVTLPRIPGHEVAATIEQTGPDVPSTFEAGMDVTLSPYTNCGTCSSCRAGRPNACRDNLTLGVQRDGAMQEHLTVPWQKACPAKCLSLEELALVEPLSVGFHAAARGSVTRDDSVAVLGCGAIGLGAVAGAAFAGATVIAVDIDPAKLDTARRAGAEHVVDPNSEVLHEALTRIAPDGPNVVIEAIGLPATYRAAVEEVAFAGRVVYVGYAREPVAYETKLFVQKELDIRGSRNALDEFASVVAMLQQGQFPVDGMISRVVPLAQAGEALAQWDADPAAVTRILVSFDEP